MSLLKLKVGPTAKQVVKPGRSLKVLSGAGILATRFDFFDGESIEAELLKGVGVRWPQRFKAVWIESEIAQTVTVWLSDGDMIDDRSETAITGASSLVSSHADVQATAQIAPPRLGRRALLIQAEKTAYVGGANVTADNGILIEAGGSLEVNTTGAVYAFAPVTARLRLMEEVN